jgi:predicted nucleic acid-binding protein
MRGGAEIVGAAPRDMLAGAYRGRVVLHRDPQTVEALLRGAKAGFLKILELEDDDAEEIAAVMKRYRDLRPQVADAALVHLAKREGIETVFTLDRRDFHVYRPVPGTTFRVNWTVSRTGSGPLPGGRGSV